MARWSGKPGLRAAGVLGSRPKVTVLTLVYHGNLSLCKLGYIYIYTYIHIFMHVCMYVMYVM